MPHVGPALCAAEIERTAARGARAITFSENPAALGLPSFWSDEWDPMLSALEETDTALCLHIGSSSRPIIPHGDAPTPLIISLMGLLTMATLSDLVMSPVFVEHPRLKVVLAEGGIGWVPYMLERLEQVWEKHRHYAKVNVAKTPAECFRDNMWACFIRDEAGIAARHEIGVDKILFEADYPHSDTMWPNSRAGLGARAAGRARPRGPVDRRRQRPAVAPDPLSRHGAIRPRLAGPRTVPEVPFGARAREPREPRDSEEMPSHSHPSELARPMHPRGHQISPTGPSRRVHSEAGTGTSKRRCAPRHGCVHDDEGGATHPEPDCCSGMGASG